jgi:hypothetical protein
MKRIVLTQRITLLGHHAQQAANAGLGYLLSRARCVYLGLLFLATWPPVLRISPLGEEKSLTSGRTPGTRCWRARLEDGFFNLSAGRVENPDAAWRFDRSVVRG